jgi:hypothetical protein
LNALDLLVFTIASLGPISAALRGEKAFRATWACFSAGFGGVIVGTGVQCYVLFYPPHHGVFPSIIEAGFLLFPIMAIVAMALLPISSEAGSRPRRLLDGLIVATALTLISWSTALGAVAHTTGLTPLAFTVSLAFPALDVAVLTMAVLSLGNAFKEKPLYLTCLGMILISLSDSLLVYLQCTYGTLNKNYELMYVIFVCGVLLIALATQFPCGAHRQRDNNHTGLPSGSYFLPYIPLGVSTPILIWRAATGHPLDDIGRLLVLLIFLLIMLRQFATLRANRQLLVTVALRTEALEAR